LCWDAAREARRKPSAQFSFKHGRQQSTKFSYRPVGWARKSINRSAAGQRLNSSYYAVFFGAIPKILRAIHSGATNTWAGLVRNAGWFPSTKWPS